MLTRPQPTSTKGIFAFLPPAYLLTSCLAGSLVGTGNIDKAIICDATGKTIWAATPGFSVCDTFPPSAHIPCTVGYYCTFWLLHNTGRQQQMIRGMANNSPDPSRREADNRRFIQGQW